MQLRRHWLERRVNMRIVLLDPDEPEIKPKVAVSYWRCHYSTDVVALADISSPSADQAHIYRCSVTLCRHHTCFGALSLMTFHLPCPHTFRHAHIDTQPTSHSDTTSGEHIACHHCHEVCTLPHVCFEHLARCSQSTGPGPTRPIQA
jgi:hypothetical protein